MLSDRKGLLYSRWVSKLGGGLIIAKQSYNEKRCKWNMVIRELMDADIREKYPNKNWSNCNGTAHRDKQIVPAFKDMHDIYLNKIHLLLSHLPMPDTNLNQSNSPMSFNQNNNNAPFLQNMTVSTVAIHSGNSSGNSGSNNSHMSHLSLPDNDSEAKDHEFQDHFDFNDSNNNNNNNINNNQQSDDNQAHNIKYEYNQGFFCCFLVFWFFSFLVFVF